MDDKIEVITLNSTNKKNFLIKLRSEAFQKFAVSDELALPENYSYDKPWSLFCLIEADQLDTYQLVYINGKFWGGSGGIIRPTEDGMKTYQAGFRTFTNAQSVYQGLGMKPYITAICIRHQIDRASALKCDNVVLSFNEKNKKLFDLVCKYHHKRSFLGVDVLMKDFTPSDQPKLFNGVFQWLIEKKLK